MKNIIVDIKKELKSINTKRRLNEVTNKIKEEDLNIDIFKNEIELAKKNIDKNLLNKVLIKKDIPGVGPKTTALISDYFKNPATLIKVIEKEELGTALLLIEGIGEKTAENITKELENLVFIVELSSVVEECYSDKVYNVKTKNLSADEIIALVSETPEVTQGISGLKISLAGEFDNPDEIIDYIESKGGIYCPTLFPSNNYLVIGKDGKKTLQFGQAMSCGVQVVTFEELKEKAESTLRYS